MFFSSLFIFQKSRVSLIVLPKQINDAEYMEATSREVRLNLQTPT